MVVRQHVPTAHLQGLVQRCLGEIQRVCPEKHSSGRAKPSRIGHFNQQMPGRRCFLGEQTQGLDGVDQVFQNVEQADQVVTLIGMVRQNPVQRAVLDR